MGVFLLVGVSTSTTGSIYAPECDSDEFTAYIQHQLARYPLPLVHHPHIFCPLISQQHLAYYTTTLNK